MGQVSITVNLGREAEYGQSRIDAAKSDGKLIPKGDAKYRPATPGSEQRCGNCVHSTFQVTGSPGSCDVVAGPVTPDSVCDWWKEPEPDADDQGDDDKDGD